MAQPHSKPKRPSGKVTRIQAPLIKRQSPNGPTFNRLTVVWVNSSGVPFDTTGFFARLIRNNQIVQTANFDRFGVVRFSRVRTLTNVSYTLRVFDSNGTLFRTRTIPAGVETFAIIG